MMNRRLFLKQVTAASLAFPFISRRAAWLQAAEFSRNLTFFLASDTHVGMQYPDCTPPLTAIEFEKHVSDSLEVIAGIPGKPWPKADPIAKALHGLGTVPKPAGLIVAGDLTEDGTATQWKRFDNLLPWQGQLGRQVPVYAGAGNHDGGSKSAAVRAGLRMRNKAMLKAGLLSTLSEDGLHAAWVWQDVHFVNVNLYPGDGGKAGTTPGSMMDPEKSLTFLRTYLAKAALAPTPVVIVQHFQMATGAAWDQNRRRAFYEAIKDYNIVALLHGHTHHITHMLFPSEDDLKVFGNGGPRFDCFSAGAFKHDAQKNLPFPGWPYPCECYVFHLTNTHLIATHYTGEDAGWNAHSNSAGLTVVKPLQPDWVGSVPKDQVTALTANNFVNPNNNPTSPTSCPLEGQLTKNAPLSYSEP